MYHLLSIIYYSVLFFFFKQKTAYDLRISDWSSDVCSSDLGVLLLVLAPVINHVLRLDNLLVAALIAVAAVPMTVMGGQIGVLQGERRWLTLSLVYIANGVPRLVIGVALLAWQPTELNAMIAVVIGQFVPVVVGWLALRHARTPGEPSDRHSIRPMIRETVDR